MAHSNILSLPQFGLDGGRLLDIKRKLGGLDGFWSKNSTSFRENSDRRNIFTTQEKRAVFIGND
jgi:hypothetical protein